MIIHILLLLLCSGKKQTQSKDQLEIDEADEQQESWLSESCRMTDWWLNKQTEVNKIIQGFTIWVWLLFDTDLSLVHRIVWFRAEMKWNEIK